LGRGRKGEGLEVRARGGKRGKGKEGQWMEA